MPTAAATSTTTTTTTTTTAALASSLFRQHPPIPPPFLTIISARPIHRSVRPRGIVLRQVALTTEVSSSSPSEEETEAAAKAGSRVRVTAPVRVYHVMKAPDLDLSGMEGTIKEYAGLWKGKRISANIPFKVEFYVPVEGQPKPVKFFAHLREDEFEYITSSD